VLPVSTNTEPSAVATKFGVKRTGRRASAARPSGRKIEVEAEACEEVWTEFELQIVAIWRL
jgi:hypothetical protein